jgi:hypothetical protein
VSAHRDTSRRGLRARGERVGLRALVGTLALVSVALALVGSASAAPASIGSASAAPAPVGSASAAPALVTSADRLASGEPLALAGPATLVAGFEGEHDAVREWDVVRSFAVGRSPVVLARVHPLGDSRGEIVLAGSPSRIALFEKGFTSGYKDCCTVFYQHLVSGPLGGPLHDPVAGCKLAPSLDESARPESGIQATSAVALDGEVLAYDSFGCVVVEDFASGLQRIIPLEATLDPVYNRTLQGLDPRALLGVAGRLVAYRDNPFGGEGPASVVVSDIDTGRELYRVPLSPYNPYEDAPTFGLQSDGTLVIVDATSCSATVSTVAHPAPLPLGIPACAVDAVRDGRALIVTPGPGNHRTLAWTSLEAPLAHPIADLGVSGALEAATPVMDETNVAYALSGCWAPSVYRAPLAEPGSPPAPPTSCPVIASPDHATLTAKALRVRIRCPLGCEGSLTASVGSARELRRIEGGAGVTENKEPLEISVAPGGTATLALLPSADEEAEEKMPFIHALARRLRRQHRLDLRLNLNIDTPSYGGAWSVRKSAELGIVSETHRHVVIPIRLQRAERPK